MNLRTGFAAKVVSVLNRVSTPSGSEVDHHETFVMIRSLPLPVLTLTISRTQENDFCSKALSVTIGHVPD